MYQSGMELEPISTGGWEVWIKNERNEWESVGVIQDKAEINNMSIYYIIGLQHKYGKSYYCEQQNSMGCAALATKYDTIDAAKAASGRLKRFTLQKMSMRFLYDKKPLVEKVIKYNPPPGHYDVEVREVGETEWLPFLEKPANLEYAEHVKTNIEKNYRNIEARVSPWE